MVETEPGKVGISRRRLRVAFMGSPDFAVPCLKALLDEAERVDLRFVVTQPDKPAGRGQKLQMPPVKEAALAAGVPVLQPTSLRKPSFAEALTRRDPPFDELLVDAPAGEAPLDLVIVVAYGKILPPDLLATARHGCWNVHGSLLPRYRGAAPIQWSVIRGETETGVTLMQMDAGMDTGAMLLQSAIPIAEDDTAGAVYEKLAPVGAALLREGLRMQEAGTLHAEPQDEGVATMAPMLEKEDGRIDWTQAARTVRDRIRGVDPWPGSYAKKGDEPLKLWRAALVEESVTGAAPGTILSIDAEGATVACGHGAVRVGDGQLPGRKRMPMAALAAGRAIAAGEVLG